MAKMKAIEGGRIIWRNIIRNWLHQAILYMDNGEKSVRLILEILSIFIVFIFLQVFIVSEIVSLILSILLVHTLNWFFNGNIWALFIFAFPNLKNVGEKETCKYLNAVAGRLDRSNSISGLMVFGSVSRGEWHEKSDIDLRVLRKEGTVNLFLSYSLLMRERIIAAMNRQPADIFLADDIPFLKKMRADEKPVFLLKKDPRLELEYPNNSPVVIKKLRN